MEKTCPPKLALRREVNKNLICNLLLIRNVALAFQVHTTMLSVVFGYTSTMDLSTHSGQTPEFHLVPVQWDFPNQTT